MQAREQALQPGSRGERNERKRRLRAASARCRPPCDLRTQPCPLPGHRPRCIPPPLKKPLLACRSSADASGWYRESPSSGQPAADSCARIWCVRPVSSSMVHSCAAAPACAPHSCAACSPRLGGGGGGGGGARRKGSAVWCGQAGDGKGNSGVLTYPPAAAVSTLLQGQPMVHHLPMP